LKTKIRRILKDSRLSNDTAIKLVSPWKGIMDERGWQDIIYRDILPKIFFLMEKFNPNPSGKPQ
jgi:hypothetical protein